MRSPAVFFLIFALALALAGAPSADARSTEFRTVPAAAPTGPDLEALAALIDDVRALADEFQLTPAQQVQVGMILMVAADDLGAQLEPIAARRAEIDDALREDPLDIDRIERLANAQGRAAAELARLEIETIIAVRDVLDASQLLLLDELRALLRDRLTEWMGQAGKASARGMMSRVVLRRAGPMTGDALTDASAAMGLSPDQRAAVRAIIEAAVPEFLAIASDLAGNRQALAELARTAPDDAGAIDERIDDRIDAQAALFEALVLLRVDVTIQIRDVLTAGQQALIGHLAPVLREHAAGWSGDL